MHARDCPAPRCSHRLARLAADVGDHFEARRRAAEAAALLDGLGYPDPTDDPPAAFARWLPPGADATDVTTLRTASTVLTTWARCSGSAARIGDGWASAALQALPELGRQLMAQAGLPGDATAQRVIELSARLDRLQDDVRPRPRHA